MSYRSDEQTRLKKKDVFNRAAIVSAQQIIATKKFLMQVTLNYCPDIHAQLCAELASCFKVLTEDIVPLSFFSQEDFRKKTIEFLLINVNKKMFSILFSENGFRLG